MRNASRRLEAAANIAVICAALLVGAIAVQQYVLPKRKSIPNQIKPGQKLSMKDVTWSEKRKYLVLGLSTTCHFCTDSAPFYQHLLREVDRHQDTAVMALLQEPSSNATDYLASLGISVSNVRQVDFHSIPISVTPTILLVNSSGIVEKVWVGKLSPRAEAEVMGAIGCSQSCG